MTYARVAGLTLVGAVAVQLMLVSCGGGAGTGVKDAGLDGGATTGTTTGATTASTTGTTTGTTTTGTTTATTTTGTTTGTATTGTTTGTTTATTTTGTTTGATGDGGVGCPVQWPEADPSMPGPYATVTENNVGPTEMSADGGTTMYTLFRPATLGQCHPVITWGNGTGASPADYSFLLTQLASHGFVVIASNSPNVGQGTPPPMLDGVTWVIQENGDSASELYQHIDVAHIGATGHSQGAFATVTAGADSRIVAIAPIEGSEPTNSLHGPALLLCGGMDTTVGCTGTQSAFTAIMNVPVMYAELLNVTHTSWILDAFMNPGTKPPFVVVVTAWMRVQLMGDTALRSMFYGPTCTLCTDTADWTIQQKMLN